MFCSYGSMLLRCPEAAKKDKSYVCPFPLICNPSIYSSWVIS